MPIEKHLAAAGVGVGFVPAGPDPLATLDRMRQTVLPATEVKTPR